MRNVLFDLPGNRCDTSKYDMKHFTMKLFWNNIDTSKFKGEVQTIDLPGNRCDISKYDMKHFTMKLFWNNIDTSNFKAEVQTIFIS